MKIRMPANVRAILSLLHAKGYEAYAVGGCVRDSVMGREPNDWDITTSATPYEVKALFQKTVDTGLQHGTVTVLMGGQGYEVTTYRIDGAYEDGRHPREVQFTSHLEEDLKRRDFTINAMAYSDETGLIDKFDGMGDLQRKIIRCVGDPWQRFEEDALRILRAVRFAAQLGCSIEKETRQAIVDLAPTLQRISAERIQVECVKLLTSDQPQMWETVYETGISRIIMPEFDAAMDCAQNTPHHCATVGKHTIRSLPEVENNKVLRLTMLLHDLGKPACKTTDEAGVDHFKGHGVVSEEIAGKILHRLKFDNDTIYQVKKLVYWHDYRVKPEPRLVRRAMNKVGTELFPLLLKVQRADTLAQSLYLREEKLKRITDVTEIYEEILAKQQCVTLKELAVNGKDLIAHGVKPGKELGEILQWMLEKVIEEPELNEKEKLLELWEKEYC